MTLYFAYKVNLFWIGRVIRHMIKLSVIPIVWPIKIDYVTDSHVIYNLQFDNLLHQLLIKI